MDIYLGRDVFTTLLYFETHLHLVFVKYSLHLGRSRSKKELKVFRYVIVLWHVNN